jgi:large subunit ribosomal protein L13
MKTKPNKTTFLDINDKNEEWHLIDARDRILGEVATEISKILIGKNKASYTPNHNWGDKVVVINSEMIKVTGNKMKDKKYHHYTGYPGGLKTENLESLLSRRPNEVIRRAVLGMIPKNKLRKKRMSNLYIYSGEEHPHQAQLTK